MHKFQIHQILKLTYNCANLLQIIDSYPYTYKKSCNSNHNAHKTTEDQNWYMPNQQTLQYKQRYNQSVNVSVELIKPMIIAQA